jgi:uncharacterized damage-inducible protein DinB
LTEHDFDQEFKVIRPGGRDSIERLRDVLYHIPIEVIHHYGKIFATFWKMDIGTPYYPYRQYIYDTAPTD